MMTVIFDMPQNYNSVMSVWVELKSFYVLFIDSGETMISITKYFTGSWAFIYAITLQSAYSNA